MPQKVNPKKYRTPLIILGEYVIADYIAGDIGAIIFEQHLRIAGMIVRVDNVIGNYRRAIGVGRLLNAHAIRIVFTIGDTAVFTIVKLPKLIL